MIPASFFSVRHKIRSYEVDAARKLSLTALLSILQEVAGAHAGVLGAGWDVLRRQNVFWVLLRLQIEIERMPRWAEEITISTWPKERQLINYFRDFLILDADGKILIRGTSTWLIVDCNTHRIRRDLNFDLGPYPVDRHAIENPVPKLPPCACHSSPVCHRAVYSDIDMNRHVNNAKYLQWFTDALDRPYQDMEIKSLFVNYISQAQEGDDCLIFTDWPDAKTLTGSIRLQEGPEYCRIRIYWQ